MIFQDFYENKKSRQVGGVLLLIQIKIKKPPRNAMVGYVVALDENSIKRFVKFSLISIEVLWQVFLS